MKKQQDEIEKILTDEIDWCLSASDEEKKDTTESFRKGFVAGLVQAKNAITIYFSSQEERG